MILVIWTLLFVIDYDEQILDGDEERLQFGGKVASRDIVQFVAMNEMKSQSPEEIAKALLEEIPGQVTEYMEQNGITLETIRGKW